MTKPGQKAIVAMIAAAVVGLLAGLVTLKLFGQPTPLG